MARQINQLTAQEVSKKLEKGIYADGSGLYLQVGKGGAKSWLFRYRFGKTASGKPRIREMGLGGLNTFSLADARHKALQYRKGWSRRLRHTAMTRARCTRLRLCACAIGDAVRINIGAFAEQIGELRELDDRERATVLLNLFGRDVSVRLPLEAVSSL